MKKAALLLLLFPGVVLAELADVSIGIDEPLRESIDGKIDIIVKGYGENVTVTLSLPEGMEVPNNSVSLNITGDSNTENIFSWGVRPELEGYVIISANVTYDQGNITKEERIYIIPLPLDPDISTRIEVPPLIKVNDEFPINITLRNIGYNASFLRIDAGGELTFEKDYALIPSLAAGESIQVIFNVMGKKAGTTEFRMELEYQGGTASIFDKEFQIVNVEDLAIASLEASDERVAPARVEFSASIMNHGQFAVSTVRFSVDGNEVESEKVDLEESEKKDFAYSYTFDSVGTHTAEFSIDPLFYEDDKNDNSKTLTLEIVSEITEEPPEEPGDENETGEGDEETEEPEDEGEAGGPTGFAVLTSHKKAVSIPIIAAILLMVGIYAKDKIKPSYYKPHSNVEIKKFRI